MLCRAQLSFWWLVPENSGPLDKRWQGFPPTLFDCAFIFLLCSSLFVLFCFLALLKCKQQSKNLHSRGISSPIMWREHRHFSRKAKSDFQFRGGSSRSSVVELFLLGLCGNPHIASMNGPCLVLRGHVIFHTISAHLFCKAIGLAICVHIGILI